MTIMSHKDCEEWAAMIAQMQDDPSYHPKYNKKGVRPVSNDKGSNDLEATIERLEFRNAKLHQHNEKIEKEIMELRNTCLLYTSPSPRDRQKSRMPSSA